MRPWTPNDPTQVGPFRTVAVLGQGGMGRVLLGVAPNGSLVAVKQVHAELADDEGFRSRFRREVDASRRVSGAYTAPVVDAEGIARWDVTLPPGSRRTVTLVYQLSASAKVTGL